MKLIQYYIKCNIYQYEYINFVVALLVKYEIIVTHKKKINMAILGKIYPRHNKLHITPIFITLD